MLIESAPDFGRTLTVRIDDELYYALTAISQSKQRSKSVIARDYLVDGVMRERKNPTYSFPPSNAALHA